MSDPSLNLRALPAAPEVQARMRAMGPQDVGPVAALHRADMGQSLWARLGLPFLEALYRELLTRPAFLAFVYAEEGRVRGFLAGASDSRGLFACTLARGWPRLVVPLLRGLLADPRLLLPLLATPLYFVRSHPGDEIPAESFFCSFEPELRGTRISGHLNRLFFQHLLRAGHRFVKITTEVDNPGSNRQLRSWGFQERGRFRFYDKQMVVYVLELPGHPRLEPGPREVPPEPGRTPHP